MFDTSAPPHISRNGRDRNGADDGDDTFHDATGAVLSHRDPATRPRHSLTQRVDFDDNR
jgi:hypothetical protein